MSRTRDRKYNPGRWQIMRERCQIASPTPPPEDPGGLKLASMFPGLIAGLRLKESPWHDELMAEWESLIGPPTSKHARPGKIQGTTLVVFVDTPVWMGEISRFGKTRILTAIQKRFGPEKITTVQLQLDPGP